MIMALGNTARSFRSPFDLNNRKKWSTSDGLVYKLMNADLQEDRLYTTGNIKPVVKAYNPEERLYISGIANANIVDRMDDRLDPRGLKMDHYLKNPQLLAHHSYYHPVGQVEELDVQEDGVYFRGWIGDPTSAPLTDMQREVRSLVSQRILKTVSVGFLPLKIRAPLFDENGEMTEPSVVEAWELLEISVVSVPCNQESLFEVRDYPKSERRVTVSAYKNGKDLSNHGKTIAPLDELKEEGLLLQRLEFDKELFSLAEARRWSSEQGYTVLEASEQESTYIIRIAELDSFENSSMRSINIIDGVTAVVGRLKGKDVESDGDSTVELIGLVRGMNDMLKRNTEVTEMLYKLLQEKESDEDKGSAGTDSNSEDDAKQLDKLSDRVSRLEKGFEKLVKSIDAMIKSRS